MWPLPSRRGLFVCGGLGVAAAAVGWRRRKPAGHGVQDKGRLWLRTAAAVVPHPAKAQKRYELFPHCGGEDAYFIAADGQSLGVADGVGGWASYGIDPGIFSRQLMQYASKAASSGNKEDPVLLLDLAQRQTTAKGSSTALLMTLCGGENGGAAVLRAANLGDSGFLLVRGGAVVLQSPAQQHSFNFPYQLGAPGVNSGGSSALDAQTFVMDDVRVGDIVVLGSDGLFDNVFPEDIASAVSKASATCPSATAPRAREAADRLAGLAASYAADKARESPFAREAMKAGLRYNGGKLDDITVLVSVVVDRAPSSEDPADIGGQAAPLATYPPAPAMPRSRL